MSYEGPDNPLTAIVTKLTKEQDKTKQIVDDITSALNKLDRFDDEIQNWKTSYEGQKRNILAFLEERDVLLARVENLEYVMRYALDNLPGLYHDHPVKTKMRAALEE